MDLSKLSTADKLIVGGGIAYLIFMFLDWFEFSEGPFSISANGWDYFLTGILPLILIAIMVAHVLITRFAPDTTLPDLPLPWGQVHLIAGVASAVLVLLRLIVPAEIEFGGFDTGEDFDRAFGLVLALIATIVVAVGGFRKSQEAEVGTGGTPPPPGNAPF